MKKTLILAAALLIFSASAQAAQPAVPSTTLLGMGLGQMRPLSDEEDLDVRGKGTFAGVWGSSQANWAGQSSANSYAANASWVGKGSAAAGSSLSFAGKVQGFAHFGR